MNIASDGVYWQNVEYHLIKIAVFHLALFHYFICLYHLYFEREYTDTYRIINRYPSTCRRFRDD